MPYHQYGCTRLFDYVVGGCVRKRSLSLQRRKLATEVRFPFMKSMTNEAKQKKLKNTDNMQQIMNGTKQNKRRQQLYIQKKSENADDTKQIEDHTKQIEDHTKQNKRRQSSWDPNSVGLGLGYFKRFDFVKPLTHESIAYK
ncbi:hypothetical protein T08_3695 [Trichinella sp. T8]|nr:hypothetical protein T08_3695 [Trichinella sp. T8]